MLHPALKAAHKILRKHGFDFFPASALSLKIISGNFHQCYADIKLSANDDHKARFEICHLYDDADCFAKARELLHGQEFTY